MPLNLPSPRRPAAALRLATVAGLLGLGLAPGAFGHMTILTADPPAPGKDEAVEVRVRFGHPFEAEQGDMPAPARLTVLAPSGGAGEAEPAPRDLLPAIEAVEVPGHDGEPARTWRTRFTPERRGDSIVIARATYGHGDQEVVDVAKLIVHHRVERGWDREAAGGDPELVPLTRPYGLFPGVTFRAELVGVPAAERGRVRVLVERLNEEAPEVLPPDERITRVELTDEGGAIAVTLPEPGWWVLCAELPAEAIPGASDAEARTRIRRALLWLYVAP